MQIPHIVGAITGDEYHDYGYVILLFNGEHSFPLSAAGCCC